MKKLGNFLRPFSIWALSLFLFLLFIPCPIYSQEFPSKPITVYCAFEAGATTDLTARALAEEAQKELGVPIVVENKAGGNGTVCATLLASKKPDGYTVAVVSFGALYTTPLITKVAYDPVKDFTYILAYGRYIGGICVKSDSPFKTAQDLIEYARKHPGALSYSSAGTGSPQQLAVESMAKQAQVRFKHLPYKGGAPACTALLGGHVDFTSGSGAHLNYVKQNVFRMLAIIISEERDPHFPDIPTLKDLGYKDVPPSRFVLVAPKGLPEPVFKKVEEGFRKAAYSPKFRKVMEDLSLPFVFRDRKQLEGEYPEFHQIYSSLLKEFGIIK